MRDPVLQQLDDLRPALVIVRVGEARVLAQCRHPRADGALAVAQPLQDHVHLRLQIADLVETHLMDFLRRERRGRARAQGPGIIFVAPRQLPDAGIAGRPDAMELHFSDLPLQRGSDLRPRDARGASRIAALHGRRALRERGDDAPFLDLARARHVQRLQRLVEEEVRRDHAHAARRLQPFGLPVQLASIGCHPRQIGVGIGRALDQVIAVEQLRRIDI